MKQRIQISKKNNLISIYPSLNRYIPKEKYTKLKEETSIDKEEKKKGKQEKENTAKSQNKNYNKKIYSINAKDNSNFIKRRNFRRKKSLGGFIDRLMKKEDDENKKNQIKIIKKMKNLKKKKQ